MDKKSGIYLASNTEDCQFSLQQVVEALIIRKILFVLLTMTLSFSILLLGRTQIPDKVLAQAEKLIPAAAFSPASYTLKRAVPREWSRI